MKFRRLFQPIKVGGVEIRNRVAMAPMATHGFLDREGSPTSRFRNYYIERAKGAVGLIITGYFKVENEIDSMVTGMPLVSGAALSPFAELAETIHALGAKIFVQLTAGLGRVARPERLKGQPVSASAVPYYWKPEVTCRELTTDEVQHIVKCFGTAVGILADAGIDGVELHAHEGYLFDQFATSIWNKRRDKYGGDLEDRLRFAVEVLDEIKKKVRKPFPVQYRFGLKHYMKSSRSGALPGESFQEMGRDIEEGLQLATILENSGFDALHVDAGSYESWYWAHPPEYQAHACVIEMAAKVKEVVSIPVIGVGKLQIPEILERILEEKKADIVAIGRGLLADPFWVRKAEADKPRHIRPCIGCFDGCVARFGKRPLSCAVNPVVGREKDYTLERTEHPREVLIVGGGVAGLEAARVATLRGHKVQLHEKTSALGGSLIPSAVPNFKTDIGRLLDWYRLEINGLDLDIRLNSEVTSQVIRQSKPDVVILATGAKPVIPNLQGAEKEKVVTAVDLLVGKKRAGETVLILGGGLIGCETALWLAQQGRKVTIVEMLDGVMTAGIPVYRIKRMMLLDLLAQHRVNIMNNTSALEVTNEGVTLIDKSFKILQVNAETVVLAVGMEADQKLYRELLGQVPNLYTIGDGREARNVMGAIWDAYDVARTV